MTVFRKILVANRGEIAIRVMRAATELGKRTVAIYAEEDKLSLHRFKADEAYRVGEGLGPIAAYLCIPEVIRVARECGADAIHPGYGLLSENPDFVDACAAAGIAFIGPSAATMRMLGDKASARRAAIAAGVPVIPATEVLGEDMDAVRAMAAEVGYPLMLKASWGGGGRGMRPIFGEAELEAKVKEGRREAEAAFGNGEGYLEKMVMRARHVEVQILGDSHGNIVHLFERDCTVQRRNQKVVERAPAPYLDEAQRAELCEYGLRIARHANYTCAGTVEFLQDADDGKFYFIEVNPRVQVEHTVTEEVTGVDIVKAQIRITEGARIGDVADSGVPAQHLIRLDGNAVQCRITTEDPLNNFIPDYGRITAYRGATGFGIRLDGGTAYSGAVITRFYDSLLEKVTAWAPTADEAVARLDRALREFRIRGVATNLAFVEVIVAPDAKPGPREIRLVTRTGVTNPMPFYISQYSEVVRDPVETCPVPVLGHEEAAERKRPPEEQEVRVTVPCVVNGQVAAGEVNHYRFEAKKGQRLVIRAYARQLIPYIADAVPGWFQAVMTLYNARGREVAYSDVYRFKPDPEIFSVTDMDFDTVSKRLRELSFLAGGAKITMTDEREDALDEDGNPHQEVFLHKGGIVEYVGFLNEGKDTVHKPFHFVREQDDVEVEIAIQYHDGVHENILSYVNAIHTAEGGTHLSGPPSLEWLTPTLRTAGCARRKSATSPATKCGRA